MTVSDVLLERRPKLEAGSYFPPEQFDVHLPTLPTRNEGTLRKLVVQELYAVCGDLYPSANERKAILGGITAHVGGPRLRGGKEGSWDNWKDSMSAMHKGTAIADLEKARRDPAAYGVETIAVHGPRPGRPSREPQAQVPLDKQPD